MSGADVGEHSALPITLSSILHVVSALGSVVLIFAHKTIIIDRQIYVDSSSGMRFERHLYKKAQA